jgi:hypothetical protein
MTLIICVILAYLLIGIIRARPILLAPVWPILPILHAGGIQPPVARTLAFMLYEVAAQMALMTTILWGCYKLSSLVFDNLVLRIIFAACGVLALAPFGAILALLTLPIQLLVLAILDFLFPRPKDA